ncbi:peptidyl-prolyl cis-trans isomerase FKBP4-like [Mizuhopecten yessoensis]|uniref:Peptidyl-prolyl cis-trans isomerase FKBP4 n=1 Tax=Mizuhopecten yessoensis TaxID=6573 RepID=A0A210QLW8_MIZYE|nr:peptidyl-prolyl cis-trans isomerase FKBP4-like [Mizuhopecten yessoensis]OWF49727.1 Peptidyl-prolyl cis-trans isomerase FKBP4 [Mizuhopecten yessoensis]
MEIMETEECLEVSLPRLDRSGLFSKTIIVEGVGLARPLEQTTCSVIVDAKDFPASSRQYSAETSLVFTIGELDGEQDLFIDKCITTMRKEEVAMFQSNEAFDWFDRPCVVTINLQHFDNPPGWPLLTNSQKYEQAKQHKQTGVELFKQEEIKSAFRQFSRATKYLLLIDKGLDVPGDIDKLLYQCHLNLAACQLRFPSAADHVITNCTKALILDHKNVKGHVRRGQAYLAKGDYSAAAQDFNKGLQFNPNNKFIQNLLTIAQNGQRAENKQLSSGLSQMFT